MPMYEYRCQECGDKFEQLRRMADADTNVICPRCASQKVVRLLSGFATTGCGGGPGRFS
ncbi:MAG: zinc ribbon domain-containing protein [Bryobacteraceae bacterium]